MSKIKHVLVLLLLILPMFALAPTLVASPNNTLVSHVKVDSSLPAQFVKVTLRVAVYAESNLTLPAYATGGVYTANHQNVIDMLESAGYAVTAISTQDILDRKLKVVDYDAFVLPNQLPRESIINHVKDYWLGGGGVLSFGASVGFLFYSGLIDPSIEGQFSFYPIDGSGLWTYAGFTGMGFYDGIYASQRNPVTKSLEEDTVYPYTGNETLLGGFDIAPILGARYLELAYQDGMPSYASIAGFDNPDRGGKIVFLSGNCSSFETWIEPVVADAIDWLAPRPKGRILYDLTHSPAYGIDSWDIDHVQYTTTQIDLRGFLVNRSYTFDKLYPLNTLSSANLAGYDILVVCDPNENFTAAEVAAVTAWINAGGSVLGIADHTVSNNQNMNYLLSNVDIGMNLTASGTNSLVPSDMHVTHEGCATMSCLAPGSVSITGSAFTIWEDTVGVPVIGGDEHGNGRVILIADGAIMRDVRISVADNAQTLINFANWLTASSAKVLVFSNINPTTQPNYNYFKSDFALSLNGLGIPYYMTNDVDYFNLSLATESWELVISDANYFSALPLNGPRLISHMESGGKLIMRDWRFYIAYPLWNYLGFEGKGSTISATPPTIHLWDTGHPIFNLPADYEETSINSTTNYFATDYTYVSLFDNATGIAGITETYDENASAIVLGVGGRAICNMFGISEYTEDTDDSTYSDAFELFTNEIAYLYFDRPTINHPDDVTYTETETGNEIIWMPVAGAGPWEYVIRENGSIIESGRWNGGAININVDGVNASLTDYQLTVFDRLGYSASDLVVLNVTEYIAPTTTTTATPLDPALLLIIGVAIVGIVIVLIVILQLKKKK